MGNPAAEYTVVGIYPGGTKEHKMLGAPNVGRLCDFAATRKCGFVTRFYPSKKGWRVLDVRNAARVQVPSGRTFWQGEVHHTRVFPTVDAAVMWAMHQYGTQPEVT
jgi:hypothetical protein